MVPLSSKPLIFQSEDLLLDVVYRHTQEYMEMNKNTFIGTNEKVLLVNWNGPPSFPLVMIICLQASAISNIHGTLHIVLPLSAGIISKSHLKTCNIIQQMPFS